MDPLEQYRVQGNLTGGGTFDSYRVPYTIQPGEDFRTVAAKLGKNPNDIFWAGSDWATAKPGDVVYARYDNKASIPTNLLTPGVAPLPLITPVIGANAFASGGVGASKDTSYVPGAAGTTAAMSAKPPVAPQAPTITTDSIQAGIDALNARIASEGITDANGKVLVAPKASTSPSPTVAPGATISSSTLNGATPISGVTSNPNTSMADSTYAGATATSKSIQDYINLLTDNSSAKSNVDSLISSLSGDINNLSGRGAAQLSAEADQGVQEKKQTLLNYQTELQTKNAEYKALQDKYQALNTDTEGKPITMDSIVGAQAQTNRVMQAALNSKASEIALVQANIAGAQGNLTLAQDAANRSVDLKYADAKDTVDLKLQQLQLLEGQLTKEEATRSDAIKLYLQDQKDKLAVQQANEKDKNATLLNQMQKYPDAGITLNDTIESANQKITTKSAIYQKETGTAAISNIDSQLTNAKGPDGYTDPNLYARLRSSATISANDFDNRFGYLVNPQSRARLGVGNTSAGVNGALTPADQTRGVNYILNNGGDQSDLDRFQNNRDYQAWIMGQAQ